MQTHKKGRHGFLCAVPIMEKCRAAKICAALVVQSNILSMLFFLIREVTSPVLRHLSALPIQCDCKHRAHGERHQFFQQKGQWPRKQLFDVSTDIPRLFWGKFGINTLNKELFRIRIRYFNRQLLVPLLATQRKRPVPSKSFAACRWA